ncbi:MAG: tRNA (guanosine(46)-N7)-methyltransferase TrmB [Holosporaceae bacterium]|nr:tRNA (guanosine(46)-N7)-methyltransferase TrmB [Holosporaceae bacterium]
MEKQHIIPSYGRKRSHGLSDSQKNNLSTLYKFYGIDLPEDIIDPRQLFEGKFDKIILEIGFGNGEHLINRALQKTSVGFIGCDPFENGVASILKEIQKHDLKNIKIFNGDVRLLLEKLKDHSIFRMYTLFPDPWGKRKHHKRRLLSAEFISGMMHKIILTGSVIIATDHEDYMLNILENLKDIPRIKYCRNMDQLSAKPLCLSTTKYEQKALNQQRKCYYIRVYV